MKSSTQWLTQQRLKSSLVVMNYSTTAAGGAKKAILAGTVSQLFCGLPPSLQSQYHIYSVPGFWQFQLTLPFKLHCSSIWFFSFQNRWLGDYKLKALRTGIRTLTTEQREPQTPFSHLSQDQEVNVGLIHSWQTLGTHLGLSLDLESYFTSGVSKNHQPSRVVHAKVSVSLCSYFRIKRKGQNFNFSARLLFRTLGILEGMQWFFQGMHRLLICGPIPGGIH